MDLSAVPGPSTKKQAIRKLPGLDDGCGQVAPVVEPSSVKFSVVPSGFEALPDIPCVQVKRSRPLKVGEKRRLAQQLEGVREHLSVATFTNAISQPDFCSSVLELEVAIDLLIQSLDIATSLNSIDMINLVK